LSRKASEVVQITVPASTEPQVIRVMVVEVRGDKSRIGFDADKSVMIHREEIQRLVDEQCKPAGGVIKIGDKLPGDRQ
jgi:carbon storage regulator CsrA